MKLDLLDSYHIRARLSVGIIFFTPVALTIFLCYPQIVSFATYSIIVCCLLALTNYLPILQRKMNSKHKLPNYAAEFLMPDNSELDSSTKQRYYRKLQQLDPSLKCLNTPENTPEFFSCCESAVSLLRERTRNNHLVMEENINFGFCKNLLAVKVPAIILCSICNLIIVLSSIIQQDGIINFSAEYGFAFSANLILLIFWILGITQGALESAGQKYARTLLHSIDSIIENHNND